MARRGLAARVQPAPLRAGSHDVGYRTPTAAFAGEVDTLNLNDPATYGSPKLRARRRSGPARIIQEILENN